MRELSIAANNIDGQPMFKVLDRARQMEKHGRDMIHLEIGDPDFNTPQNVVDAGIKSLLEGNHHYCSSFGLPEFRELITVTTEKSRGFKPSLSQVLVTPGANVGIFYAVFCLVNPGQEVIVPDPGFPTYYSTIKMCGATPVRVPLKENNEFRMNPDDIRKVITEKTRLIIINSPHNPTGSVMTKDEIEAVYKIAQEYDLYVYSDEIYARMNYDPVGFSTPGIYDRYKERVMISNGFSKAFAMTGWRLGTLIGPENVIERMAMLLQTTSSCVSPFIQHAGMSALTDSQETVQLMMNEYRHRRDILVSGLNQIKGINCLIPGGAFYVFPNIKETGYTSTELTEQFLQAGVVGLPGDCFGNYGDGYMRFCYANSRENIYKALERMKTVLGSK